MFDWDDLRIYLAAAQSGSLSAAALQLGVDAATVGRRVSRLETALKATLLIRQPSGLQVTAAGARVLEMGLKAKAAVEAAARVGEPDVVGGTVRLSVAEGFGGELVAPALPALRAARPALRIELAANAGLLSPGKREVDMAVTLSAPASARLYVEPLTDYELGLYAAPAYLARVGRPVDAGELERFDIVGYVDDLLYAPELRYLDEIKPGLFPSLSSSSIRAQRAMLASGGGIGVLPCFMADGLDRVLGGEVRLRRRFWLATRLDVADTARIRLLHSWLKALVGQRRDALLPAG